MDCIKGNEELDRIRAAIVLVVRQTANYWDELASDYQTKYAFSSDYDKSYKQDYYRKARACRILAHRIEQIPFPEGPDEKAVFIDTIVQDVGNFPRQIRMQRELEPLFEQLERLRG